MLVHIHQVHFSLFLPVKLPNTPPPLNSELWYGVISSTIIISMVLIEIYSAQSADNYKIRSVKVH